MLETDTYLRQAIDYLDIAKDHAQRALASAQPQGQGNDQPTLTNDTQAAIVPEVCEAFTEWNDGPDRIFSDRLLNALHTLVAQQQQAGT